ncbi:MAG: DNA-formamidopyrimidine glycosylase family protein [Propionibacteriaceae bacterium]|nr:DNA-formamidopyrimidine glycosylase family protein [Propionibacteriaceae bacterium]
MPEGHVIHRLAHVLNERLAGKRVAVTSPQGRFAAEAARLDGQPLTSAEAIGKHLLIEFDVAEPRFIHIHLGLIGKLRIHPLAPPVGEVRLRISDGDLAADLHGPQWCRMLTATQRAEVHAASGPDPLRPDDDPLTVLARIQRSRRSIAALLMDQKIAAGVGNIFRAEVLFRHCLPPMTPGNQIDEETWLALWQDLKHLMAVAVERGRIDTVADEHSPEAQQRPPREDPHGGEVYVYRRAGQPCLRCATPVSTTDLEGRSLYWCDNCQRGG